VKRWLWAAWAVAAAPGVVQLGLLLFAIGRRFAFPYDLEWMEGGMLNHALRLSEGHTIYPPPSVDFIPYLYTPLYPALLAALGKVFGLSYQLGRAVSILSLAGVFACVALAVRRAPGALLAIGIIAAAYPWFEGWYDIVRGDTLFLALGTGGLVYLRRIAGRPEWRPFLYPHAAAAGAILALSFFAKQTGVLLVAAGGAALLVMNWRALLSYVLAAGLVGGGGSAALNAATGGWFWIYVFKVHQQHETFMPRFWQSFPNIFLHFPIVTAVLAAGLVAAAVWRRDAADFLYWAWMTACGALIGAFGWATQWAHFNAYIPAITFAAIAVGCATTLPRIGLPAAFALAAQLVWARWSPAPFIPTKQDRSAGDELIARIAKVPGDVFVPSHPWYSHLAGKRTFTHRMGIMDVTFQGSGKAPLPPRARVVEGLPEALRGGKFGAVVLDDRYEAWELPGLNEGYRPETVLPAGPRVVTGAHTVPRTIWAPSRPEPLPPGTRQIYDFEGHVWPPGFTQTGDGWGSGPQRLAGSPLVGARGQSVASSNWKGDKGTGTLLSPPFTVTGRKITLRVAGGDGPKVRAELRDATTGAVLRTAKGIRNFTFQLVEWDVAALRGKPLRLALVDEDTGTWGVLWVDDVREVE
jgi:hypothetical protein